MAKNMLHPVATPIYEGTHPLGHTQSPCNSSSIQCEIDQTLAFASSSGFKEAPNGPSEAVTLSRISQKTIHHVRVELDRSYTQRNPLRKIQCASIIVQLSFQVVAKTTFPSSQSQPVQSTAITQVVSCVAQNSQKVQYAAASTHHD